MRPYVIRQEQDGTGYLFDRSTGAAKPLSTDELIVQGNRHDADFIPLAKHFPQHARVAPFCVWFELTRQCNLECPYCGAPPREHEPDSLSPEQISSLFQDMVSGGVFEIRFTGGEPTLHPNFVEVVRRAATSGFYVSLNSNGCMSDQLRSQLIDLPVGLYILSLDGPQLINDQLRTPSSYDRIIRTIKVLTNSGKRVRVNTVLCKKNKDHLPQLVAVLKQLKVEGATLVPLRPAGRAKDIFPREALTRSEYGQVLTQVRQLRQAEDFDIAASYDTMSPGRVFNTPAYFTRRCVAGVESACLGPNGNLRACILLDDPRFVVGNLLEKSFSELWADDELWGIFRDKSLPSTRCRGCQFFSQQCPGTCHAIAEYFGSPEIDPYCQIA